MKKYIILLMFSVITLAFTSCDDDYTVSDALDNNEAIVVNVFIDPGEVSWDQQRDFYDHENLIVTIHVVPGSIGNYESMRVWISGSFQATMSPLGGEFEDWTGGERSYTFTSGDKSVTNTYRIVIVEDLIL